MPVTGAATHCALGGPPGQSSATVRPVMFWQTVGSAAAEHRPVLPLLPLVPLVPLVPPLVELELPPQGVTQNCCSQVTKVLSEA
jgi:hypothetical protein